MNEMSTMGIKRDIPIILDSVSTEDTYEGEFITRRALIHTLVFTVKAYIYGRTPAQGIIREVDVNLGANLNDQNDVNIDVKPTTSKHSTSLRMSLISIPTRIIPFCCFSSL